MKKKPIGTFTSEWSDGEVITTDLVSFDIQSGEVLAKVAKDDRDHGGVVAEYITLGNGEEYQVCLHCHEYILKPTIVNDTTGKGIHEELICQNPDCDDIW